MNEEKIDSGGRSCFQRCLDYYRSQHRTKGCKVTHMVGVPLVVASIFFLPRNVGKFIQLQVLGWILQFIGHYVFERNKPVILEVRSPYTIAAALVFVWNEWKSILTGGEI